MIWTITLRGYLYARPGKSVWKTRQEAERALTQQADGFILGYIEADWDKQTLPLPELEPYNQLLINADIIPVDD